MVPSTTIKWGMTMITLIVLTIIEIAVIITVLEVMLDERQKEREHELKKMRLAKRLERGLE